MKIDELVAKANEGRLSTDREVTARLVRFLTTEGVVFNSAGRKFPDYPEANVARLHFYRAMQRVNQPIKQIVALLSSGASSFELAPGLLVLVNPSALEGTLDPSEIGGKAASLARSLNEVNRAETEMSDAA